MSANFSKTPSFKRQVYFSDEACTRPDLITYQLSNKDDCVTKSFCGVAAPFPLQETCVDTPNLPADAAEFFQNRPYAIFDNFLEPNCLGYSHSSAVPMNSCILIEGDQSTSTTFLPNGSVQDTTFNGPDCTRGINVTATYSPNGECNGVWRLTAYNYASETSAASAVSSQTSLASPMTRVMESGSGSGQLSPESNLGAILGGVAGGVVVLAAITAFLCMRYTKKQIGDKQLVLSHDNHDATADAQIPFMISSLAQDSTTNQTAHQLQTLQTANPNIQLPPTQVAPVLLPEENDAYRQLQYFSILPLPKPLGDEPIGSSKQLHDLAQQLQSSFPLGSTTSFLDNTLTSSALPPPTITTHTLQPIQIGKVSFPLDPQAWSVAEVALWIVDNGGSQDSARLVNEQDVDGCALLTATVPELADTLEIRTLGQRVRFQVGVDKLRAVAVGVATAAAAASVEVVEAPPAYFNTA
ncbi:hypothetical protein BJ741DRAFT_637298 [Chytriomyces cf. hyalinus JEL632]|nr:hypothetical protein BJ741DRAFT_637298 [Chytriomyces cf. hyalinus JEL632]